MTVLVTRTCPRKRGHGTRHPAPGTRHPAPGTRHPAHIKHFPFLCSEPRALSPRDLPGLGAGSGVQEPAHENDKCPNVSVYEFAYATKNGHTPARQRWSGAGRREPATNG